jgi:hypothetical protein
MSIRLGSAYGKIELDASGVKTGVETAIGSLKKMSLSAVMSGESLIKLAGLGEKLGAGMQRLGGIMTLALSGPLLLLAKTAVQQSANVQDAMRRTNDIFGESASKIAKWADGAAMSFGMSKGAALDAANTFGTLFTQLNLSADKASEMSSALVQLAADVAKFNKGDPAAVVTAFQQALEGNLQGLEKYNIQIADSEIVTKAAELGLLDYTTSMKDVDKATRDAEEAQRKLSTAQSSGGVDADKVTSAQRKLVNAQDAVSDATIKVQRAEEDLAEVRAKKKATDTQKENATRRLADAEERLADAQKKAGWAARDLNNARQPIAPNAEKIASAENSVADAEGRLSEAMKGKVSELDDATKATIIYALMMEKTKNMQGAFSKSTGDFSTQLIIFKAVMSNTFEKLGNVMLPTLTKLLIQLNKFLDWFVNAPKWVQTAVVGFLTFLFVLGPLIAILGKVIGVISTLAGLSTTLGGLGISFGAVAAAVGTAMTAIVGFGASAIAALLPILLPIALLIVAVGLLYLAFKNNFMGITTAFRNLGANLKTLWAITVGYLVSRFGSFGTSVMNVINAVKTAWATFVAWIQKPIKWPTLPDWLKPGSPTPFEIGLRGIVSAMQAVDMAAKPEMIARTMAKPVQNMSSSSSSSNVFNLSSGLTLRDVDQLFDEKINRFAGQLTKAMA